MKILGIDTAHGTCSVAISDNDIIIAEKTELEASKQAERLLPIINELLLESNLSYSDLNAIAADIGPGSFTGVRIGLAASHGIALAAKIPLIGVSSFEALEYKARSENTYENLLVILDAKRGQVFVQHFNNGTQSEPIMLEYKDIGKVASNKANIVIIGNGISLIEAFLHEHALNYRSISNLTIPNASMIALCASNKLRNSNFAINPTPLYIRPPDAKLPQNKNNYLNSIQ